MSANLEDVEKCARINKHVSAFMSVVGGCRVRVQFGAVRRKFLIARQDLESVFAFISAYF